MNQITPERKRLTKSQYFAMLGHIAVALFLLTAGMNG
jgi:hypothetical protein